MFDNCDKYTIKNYATSVLIDKIIKELDINKATYYRKANVKIGERGGFEVSQMLIIASILNRPISDLITNEAVEYYKAKKVA